MFTFDPPENVRKPLVFWRFQGNQSRTSRKKGLGILFMEKNFFDRNVLISILIKLTY